MLVEDFHVSLQKEEYIMWPPEERLYVIALQLAVMATADTINKLSENSHTSPISGPTLWVSEWTQTRATTATSA